MKDLTLFYWLDKEMITCKYRNSVKPIFESSDENFISNHVLVIPNNRNNEDVVIA